MNFARLDAVLLKYVTGWWRTEPRKRPPVVATALRQAREVNDGGGVESEPQTHEEWMRELGIEREPGEDPLDAAKRIYAELEAADDTLAAKEKVAASAGNESSAAKYRRERDLLDEALTLLHPKVRPIAFGPIGGRHPFDPPPEQKPGPRCFYCRKEGVVGICEKCKEQAQENRRRQDSPTWFEKLLDEI